MPLQKCITFEKKKCTSGKSAFLNISQKMIFNYTFFPYEILNISKSKLKKTKFKISAFNVMYSYVNSVKSIERTCDNCTGAFQ